MGKLKSRKKKVNKAKIHTLKKLNLFSLDFGLSIVLLQEGCKKDTWFHKLNETLQITDNIFGMK